MIRWFQGVLKRLLSGGRNGKRDENLTKFVGVYLTHTNQRKGVGENQDRLEGRYSRKRQRE